MNSSSIIPLETLFDVNLFTPNNRGFFVLNVVFNKLFYRRHWQIPHDDAKLNIFSFCGPILSLAHF